MLEQILKGIEVFEDPNVLVGFDRADDAGVYRLDERTALVQTIDFFTPVVDDPGLYGQIAAANALSDIYAMGGEPRFALCVAAFPKQDVELEILRAIVRGGSLKMKEAGVPVIGGHSVQDPEIKFGYCVTGLVKPSRIYTNSGAKPGDWLLLTKPLGTGTIATGIKYQKAPADVVQEATQWMLLLNRNVSTFLEHHSVHAVTDITGFGLAGHALELARASHVTLEFQWREIPLMKGALELARQGMLPAGIESNRRFAGEHADWGGTPENLQQLFLDPQTSGGLLISLPEKEVEPLSREVQAGGQSLWAVGRVRQRTAHPLRFL